MMQSKYIKIILIAILIISSVVIYQVKRIQHYNIHYRTDCLIQDKYLEQDIRAALEKFDGELTKEDLKRVYILKTTSSKVYNLEGIQLLTNLTSIDLTYNHISDLSKYKT